MSLFSKKQRVLHTQHVPEEKKITHNKMAEDWEN